MLKKKILALLLVFCMILTQAAFAQNETAGEGKKVYTSEKLFGEYIPGLPSLATPTNLKWNTDNEGNNKNGFVAWSPVKNCEGEYDVELYRNGERVFFTNWMDLYNEGTGYISIDFVHTGAFNQSGSYTFSVKAVGDKYAYNDSTVATSGVYNFTAPSQKLDAPTEITWLEGGVIRHKVVSGAGKYMYDFYDQNFVEVGGMWGPAWNVQNDYVHEDAAHYIKEMVKWNKHISKLYVKVTALTSDIEKIKNSSQSAYSPAYDISAFKNKAQTALNNALENLYRGESSATETLDNLLNEMAQKDISNTDLAVSLIKDESLVETVRELEAVYQNETGINVSVENSQADSSYLEDKGIDPESISVVGAALNSDNGNDVSISFSKADDSLSVDEAFYKNSVAVEINIDGVKNSGKLDIPVQITMPVPNGVLPERFVVLHYHADGSVEKIRPAVAFDGQSYYATITLTSFSPFVFCNEDIGVKYDSEYNELIISSAMDVEEAVAYIAAYDGDELLCVESVDISLFADNEDYFTLEFFDATDADKVKVMIWDKRDNLKPLIDVNEILAF